MDVAAQLIQFEHSLRQAEDSVALQYIIVNELKDVLTYEQAFIAKGYSQDNFKVMASANIVNIDRTAPTIQLLDNLVKHKYRISNESRTITGAVSDWGDDVANQLSLPPFFAWMPLHHSIDNGRTEGCVLLFRYHSFAKSEAKLLDHLSSIITHSIAALRGREYKYTAPTKKKVKLASLILSAVFILCCFIPVDLSVIASGKLAPEHPQIITAPFSGVIERVLVDPDTQVTKGQVLAKYNTQELEQELMIKRANLEQAKVRLSQMSKQGFVDIKARQEISILQSDVEIAIEEVKLSELRLNAADLTANRSGVVVIDNTDSWAGRPVQSGEHILSLVEPDRYLLELYISADNMIVIEKQKHIRFYLDSQPLSPINAKIISMDFEPKTTSTGELSYRVLAQFLDVPDDMFLRIGLKGTARVYGAPKPLIYQLLRKPIVALRQMFG